MKKIILLILAIALAAGFYFWRQHQAAAHKPAMQEKTIKVDFATVLTGDAPVLLSAIGQVVPAHTVAIRPQVVGTLTQVFFKEGDNVKAGQKLFAIDAAPYQAALAQAQAQLSRDRAAIQAAESQEQRLAPLADKGYVTPQELLDAKATAAQARASVKASEAAASAARITAGRALITSPIAGRTGSLTVKAGNIVNSSDANPLVTVNQLQPVQAEFAVPQSELAAVREAIAKGSVTVTAHAQEGGAVLGTGKLIFVDNAVDATTGTVKLKAEFANADEQLWPGSFVTLEATLSVQKDAVLAPEQAVQAGASGPFVYLVGGDHKATLHPVKVQRQVGGNAVIAEGLNGGELIVARVPRALTPGALVADAKAAPADKVKGAAEQGKAAP